MAKRFVVEWVAVIFILLIFGGGSGKLSTGNIIILGLLITLIIKLIRKGIKKVETQKYRRDIYSTSLEDIDPFQFEEYVAEHLRLQGYTDIDVTPKCGDYGADVIARDPGGDYVAIQCKKYSSPIGVKAVQEVVSAKSFYNCQKAAVYGTSSFTNQAINMARKTGTKLVTLTDSNRINLNVSGIGNLPKKIRDSTKLDFPEIGVDFKEIIKKAIILIAVAVVTYFVAKGFSNFEYKDISLFDKSRHVSGTIITDTYADKSSYGIFTNKLDKDIIVSCYYPKMGETLIEFYLNKGDTVELDMPYATLQLYIISENQKYKFNSVTKFPINQNVEVIIQEDLLSLCED